MELAKLYDLQDIVGIGTTSKVYKCKRRARADVFACKVRGLRGGLAGVALGDAWTVGSTLAQDVHMHMRCR